MRQHQAVIQAMEQNGGYATLGRLYQTALRIPGATWGTKTPFASIRRIVQERSEFFRIKPGLWGLVSQRDRILDELGISEKAKPDRREAFDHTYYQGLLAEIGALKGFETFVPAQDRNRPFLNHRLGEVATLAAYFGFTYESLVRRARTVDVTWFNERQMPFAFYEVEHSTDIQNSLLKFLEFQDFRIQFWIVADSARRAEVDSKLAYTAFRAIRSDVRFMDYGKVSEWHSKASEVAAVENSLMTPGR